jgi:glucose-6-phosphate 1-dehydrogenase
MGSGTESYALASLYPHLGSLESTSNERLLGDALEGENALFARQDGVEAAWEIVDDILRHRHAALPYEPGTWGPEQAGRIAASHGGWVTPAAAATR